MDITKFYFTSKPILESLNSIDLAFFNEHMKLERVSKGVQLYKEGSQSKGVYIIKKGKVKLYQTKHDNEDQIIYIYTAGDMFGYRPLLFDGINFASVMTIEECEFYVLDKNHFLSLQKRSIDLNMLLLKITSHEFTVIINYISAFFLRSGRERVALCLMILEERYKLTGISPTEITISRTDLASFSGIALETLSRIIAQFKDENLINVSGRIITLQNRYAINLLAKG